MTAEQIDYIRTARACNVPRTVISRHLGYTVAECRQALLKKEQNPLANRDD